MGDFPEANSGLLKLPFMQRALERQKREAEAAAEQVIKDVEAGREYEGDFDAQDVFDEYAGWTGEIYNFIYNMQLAKFQTSSSICN